MFVRNASNKRFLTFITIMLLLTIFATGCNKNDSATSGQQGEYKMISAKQAKELMDTKTNYVILDVRTQSEYDEGHIKNAILIPDYEIKNRAEKELKDKNQLILVYCRSGNRSKSASAALASLGYKNVNEFGGIIDWPYEII